MSLFSLTLSLLCTAPSLEAQDPIKILQQAFAIQQPAESPEAVKGFVLQLNMRERGETRNDVDLEVSYLGEPSSELRMGIHDSSRGTHVFKGFDGSRYWLREANQEELVDLSSREYAQDREAIDQAMETCDSLLVLFDFRRLSERLQRSTLETTEHSQFIHGWMIVAGAPAEITVRLNREDLLPTGLSIGFQKTDEQGKPLFDKDKAPVIASRRLFELSHHHDFQGLVAPRLIREFFSTQSQGMVSFQRDEKAKPIRILEVHALEWRNQRRD